METLSMEAIAEREERVKRVKNYETALDLKFAPNINMVMTEEQKKKVYEEANEVGRELTLGTEPMMDFDVVSTLRVSSNENYGQLMNAYKAMVEVSMGVRDEGSFNETVIKRGSEAAKELFGNENPNIRFS